MRKLGETVHIVHGIAKQKKYIFGKLYSRFIVRYRAMQSHRFVTLTIAINIPRNSDCRCLAME